MTAVALLGNPHKQTAGEVCEEHEGHRTEALDDEDDMPLLKKLKTTALHVPEVAPAPTTSASRRYYLSALQIATPGTPSVLQPQEATSPSLQPPEFPTQLMDDGCAVNEPSPSTDTPPAAPSEKNPAKDIVVASDLKCKACRCCEGGVQWSKFQTIAEDSRAYVEALPAPLWPNHIRGIKSDGRSVYSITLECGSRVEVNYVKLFVRLFSSCQGPDFLRALPLGNFRNKDAQGSVLLQTIVNTICPCEVKQFCGSDKGDNFAAATRSTATISLVESCR